MQNESEKKIWKELKKYGITNEKELDEAIEKLNLNIACFVNQVEERSIYEKFEITND